MNRLIVRFLSILIVFIVLVFTSILCSKSDSKVIVTVLGFRSKYINNVQDRILRETILRRFKKRGFSIVPVMELERFFFNYNTKIRDIKISGIKRISREFKTDYIVNGTIDKKGKLYLVTVIVYNKKGEAMNRFTINIDGKKVFNEYGTLLAEGIVEKVEGIVNK